MKRTLLILCSILVGVFVVLSVLGTKSEYGAEKALHKINVQFNKIKADTVAAPEASYTVVIEGYKRFMEKHPKSKLVPLAHLMIGRTFMLKKDYASARDAYERIYQIHEKSAPSIAAQALMEISATYANEGNAGELVKTHERIIREFPTTAQGLSAPLSMAKMLASRDPQGADRYFDNAIGHYRALMQKYPETILEFKALNYIASTQMTRGKFSEAVNIYAELLMTYAETNFLNSEIAALYLRTINSLAIIKQGDFDKPIAIYGNFMNKYPNHPLNETLLKMIQGIKELKQRQMENQTSTAQ